MALLPGVTYIGVGSTRELRDKAQQQGMNVLLIFQVKVAKNPRTGSISNDTRLVLQDVATGTELARGDELNNVKIQNAREKDSGDDTVENMFAKFLGQQVDQKLKAVELPAAVTADAIRQSRLPLLTASEVDNPLPLLAEIRFYRTRDLLTDEDVLAAFTKIVGEEAGKKLATGTEDERKEAVSEWLPSKDSVKGSPRLLR